MKDDLAPVVYGSLHVDKGETIDHAMESIVRGSAQKPTLYFYDIICTSEQEDEAYRLLGHIRQAILDRNPQLDEEKVYTAITTNMWDRAAAKKMVEVMGPEAVKEAKILDLNPSRAQI